MNKYIVLILVLKQCSCTFYCGTARYYVDVSNTYKTQTSTCKSNSNSTTICSNIQSAFDLSHLNHSCLRIHDNQELAIRIDRSYITHLYVTANMSANIKVNCTSTHSGVGFIWSNQIFVSNILFLECGMKHNSTAPLFSGELPLISSAFYFKYVINIAFNNVQFLKSNGYSIVMYDVTGNINMEKLYVGFGQEVKFIHDGTVVPGLSSGGGIYIEYTSNVTKEYSSNATFRFDHCKFTSNKADMVSSHAIVEGIGERHIPFARGGGLVIFFMGSTHDTHVILSEVIFSWNSAAWGGGMYVRYRDEAARNKLYLVGVDFLMNEADYAGGGIIITSTQKPKDYNNTIYFEDCTFWGNKANIGGGISHQRIPSSYKEHERTHYKNCSFIRNKALLGSAIQLKHVEAVFTSVNISHSGIPNIFFNIDGHGAVYAFESLLLFYGHNYIQHNNDTAFILDCSNICFEKHIEFNHNHGRYGGAMSLFGHSKIYLRNTTNLLFNSNTASQKGGAIHITVPGPSQVPKSFAKLQIYECLFQFQGVHKLENAQTFKGRVVFKDNYSGTNGDSIFATTLTSCKGIANWPNFSIPPSTISTHAIYITVNKSEWLVWPGKLFTPTIRLQDEFFNNVSETIDVLITPNTSKVSIQTNYRFVVRNSSITLKLLGKNTGENRNFTVTIIVVNYGSTFHEIHNLSLQHCYFGYTLVNKNECKCNLQKNQAKGISVCFDQKIYLFKGRWADPNQKAILNDAETTQVCPANYCNTTCPNNTLTGNECPFKPLMQCAIGRNQTSRLCSKCEGNLSVAIGGESCLDCSHGWRKYNYAWIIPCIILGISIVILFLLWLNVDIYSNYLNGFLYYYQVVSLLTPSNFDYVGPITLFIGFINIDSPGGLFKGFCLFDNFNDLQKNAFNYIFPGWMLAFLVVVSFFAKYNSYFSRQNCFRALTIISVVAYGDFTRITFKLLEVVSINEKKWVRIYADIAYNSSDHLGYEIFGFIAIVVVVIGFPIMLILSTRLIGLHSRFCVNPLTRWNPIFQSFKYCFRFNQTWFASYYFLCRTLFLSIATFTTKEPLQNVILAFWCFAVCIFFTMNLPYKCMWMNLFDVLALANLTAIAILSLGMRSAFSSRDRNNCETVISILIYIPLMIVCGRLCYVYFPKMYHGIREKYVKHRYERKKIPIPQRPLLQHYSQSDDEYME